MAVINSYLTRSFQNSANVSSSQSTVSDTGLIYITDTIPVSSSNTVTLAYDVSAVTAVYVAVDVDGVTANPGSGTSATLTFTDALIPYIWQSNCNYVNVWDDDFSTVVFTNPSADDECTLTIWIAYTV